MLIFMKYIFLYLLFSLSAGYASANTSTCYGSTAKGRLDNGVQLPYSGANFESYSMIARLAGRTYVHSSVKKIMLNAYKYLEQEQPNKKYKYAETGFKEGGRFKPHKTHTNGLSIDFMVPVINKSGKSVYFSTTPFNKFGYNIEFDNKGKYEDLKIDYEALAAHIVALHKEAKKLKLDLWRVIFNPKLQPYLFKTKYANYLKKHIQFSKKRSWVRHDEHYHVDFSVPCKKMS